MRGGLIELGSNSFRLVVADHGGVVATRNHHLGLARSVSMFGSLTRDDLQRATLTARELLDCAHNHGCDHIAIVATEVFRLASNGSAAAEHITEAISHPVHILPAAEETALAFLACATALPDLDRFTMIDLGGGSLGVASGAAVVRPEHHFSLQLGVELLAPRALDDDLLSVANRIRLEHHIASELQPVARTVERAGEPLVLVGGAARALAQVVHTARRGRVPDSVHGLTIDWTDLGHLIGRLSDLPRSARLAVPGMKPRRAATFPLAAAILRQAMISLGGDRAIVSTAGVRDAAMQQLHNRLQRAA